MLIHHGATSGSPHSAPARGASRFPHHSRPRLPPRELPGTSAAPSQAAAGTQPSHWSAFVCPVQGIHALIWIYANVAAVLLPPLHQRETPTSSSNPATPLRFSTPPPLTLTHTHRHAHHPSPFIFFASFPLSFCLWPPPRPCGLTAVGTRSALSHRFIPRRSKTVNYQADTYSRSQAAG